MASRIQPKEATLATTGVACLVAAMSWILIGSIYVTDGEGWPNFALNVFSALAVCAVGVTALAYAVHQQYVAKSSLFADHEPAEFDCRRPTGQWAVVTGAADGIGNKCARQAGGNDKIVVPAENDRVARNEHAAA